MNNMMLLPTQSGMYSYFLVAIGPSALADFRSIRLGDLNLLQTIQCEYLDKTGLRLNLHTSTSLRMIATHRTVYQARVAGSNEDVTVVVYVGHDHAEVSSRYPILRSGCTV